MPRARLELAYGQAVGDFELEAGSRTVPRAVLKSMYYNGLRHSLSAMLCTVSHRF